VVMRHGAIAQIGAPRDIYFTPADRFVAEFIGAANIIEATAKDGFITLPGGQIGLTDAKVAGPVVVMIRPETIKIVAGGDSSLAGRIETVSFVGDRVRLTVSEATERPLAVDSANSTQVRVGDRVGLAIDPAAVRLLGRR
jgi:putative spermidine/putrescine transport system ATP-binding protein